MRSLPLLRHPLVALPLLGLALMLPALLWGPGTTHSHQYNYLWTQHFGREMAAGHFYERWLPASFEGIGSPAFYFYPPFAYWMGGGLNAIGIPVLTAINLTGLVLLVASGLAMYRWLAARGTRPLLGAALYMAAPYHLHDIYVRGALAEAAAFVWLPLIALAIDRLPQRRAMLLLAASCAALLLSHLPLAMLTALFLVTPMVARRLWRRDAVLVPAALAGGLAFGLAAFYLLPAMTLQSHVSISMLWGPDYRATDWSVLNASFELFPSLALGLMLLAWPAARSFWGVTAMLLALLSIRLIPFVWHIEMLNKVQFPWRALCLAEFAAVTAMISVRPRPAMAAGGALLLLFPYAFTGFMTAAFMARPDDSARIERIAPDAPEYLPRGFDLTHVERNYRWTDMRAYRALPRGDTILVKQAGPVTLGHAAFPIWRVKRDGQPVASEGPLIHFTATPGLYRVERVTLWQERWGAAISLAAAFLFALMAMGQRRISHLSKFATYSPLSPRLDRPARLALRSRQSGGDV
jgi:hypothetical protein